MRKTKALQKHHLLCFLLAIYSWTWDLDLRSYNLSETWLEKTDFPLTNTYILEILVGLGKETCFHFYSHFSYAIRPRQWRVSACSHSLGVHMCPGSAVFRRLISVVFSSPAESYNHPTSSFPQFSDL